ncbi:porin [Moraxella catarrhalis]|uniref:Outer membrane protein porin n=1 Tax=Moraxella catarrhalis TaxID=480 RepID=A0A198UG18_MORCA|nr:porin [Moraxella catarrhalis]OAU95021.1 Outer membrane protein porin [Moraxella catarrhalis]OAU95373.1 Outer membrane protein porin [Moraxella catarrhalis]OAU98245.1 Outer membrane protein porin [Moraxella catarrhalis]
MKKLVLATAVAALSITAAQAAPTVYGKAFLTVDANNTDTTYKSGIVQTKEDTNTSGLNSNTSRIGLKGSEALTADIDVVYQLEYGVAIDNGAEKQFTSRDTYLGLAHKEYGTLLAGRLTTIDDNVDFASMLEGNNVADIGPSFSAPRANNAFAYVSPEYNGAQFLAMYAFDSDTDEGGIADKDQYGIGATYSTGPINAGASYIAYGKNNHLRLSGNYAVSPALTAGALYQISKFETPNSKKENTLIVSGEMKTATPWTAYGQATLIKNVAGNDGDESVGVGIGGKYAFNKAATGHVYTGYVNSERKNVTYEGNNDTYKNTKFDDYKNSGFGIGAGLEYKF